MENKFYLINSYLEDYKDNNKSARFIHVNSIDKYDRTHKDSEIIDFLWFFNSISSNITRNNEDVFIVYDDDHWNDVNFELLFNKYDKITIDALNPVIIETFIETVNVPENKEININLISKSNRFLDLNKYKKNPTRERIIFTESYAFTDKISEYQTLINSFFGGISYRYNDTLEIMYENDYFRHILTKFAGDREKHHIEASELIGYPPGEFLDRMIDYYKRSICFDMNYSELDALGRMTTKVARSRIRGLFVFLIKIFFDKITRDKSPDFRRQIIVNYNTILTNYEV